MSVQGDALEELRSIAEECHEMMAKINKGKVSNSEMYSFITVIRDCASEEYMSGAKELGWIDEDYNLIAEFNKED